MVTKYWARLIPDDVAKRAQVVFASDYAALEARCATLTAEVMHYTAGTPHPLEARCRELEAALKETSVDRPCRHYDNPALCKICNPTAPETKAECIHKWIGLAQGGFRCTQCDAELEDQL